MARNKTTGRKKKKDNSLRNAIIAFGVTLLGYASLFSFHRLSDFLLGGGIALLVSSLIKTMTTPMKGLEAPTNSSRINPDDVQDEYARDTIATGLELMAELRAERDAISEYVFTRRLNELADTYGQLLNRVVADHEKAPHLRKLNTYYLPTVIKLLRSYRDAKSQGTSYMEISATRDDILKTLDQLISANKKLQKKMLRSHLEAMDIKIEVLEDILRADGYIEDEVTENVRTSAEHAAAQMTITEQVQKTTIHQPVAQQPRPAPTRQKQAPAAKRTIPQPAQRPSLKANVPTASAQQLERGAPVLRVPGLLNTDEAAPEDEQSTHS